MKTLNLTDIGKSDIKYQIQKFPDGQNNLVLNPYSVAEIKTIRETNKLSIQIKSRLNNWLDLELIVCAVAALREIGVEEIHLYTPYIIGARSDRKFEEGGNNYLKDVICPIINSLNFKTVTCIDPHSNCLEMGLNNFKKIDNYQLLVSALKEIYYPNSLPDSKDPNKFVLVSPDAGASHKIYKLAEQIGYKGDIITCSKERDSNGNIVGVEVPIDNRANIQNKDLIIIDDICDGGATFINIAKAIKEYNYNNNLYLIVTHGIFSKGFEELSEHFNTIYCTNSYSNVSVGPGFVKQLNVF